MSYGEVFGGMLILSFGAFTLFSGLFTAYFGAGKSRRVGLMLTILGTLFLVAFYGTTWGGIAPLAAYHVDPTEMLEGMTAVLAATVGGLIAFGLFLASIMRA